MYKEVFDFDDRDHWELVLESSIDKTKPHDPVNSSNTRLDFAPMAANKPMESLIGTPLPL